MKKKIIATSGGFDPPHAGHAAYIAESSNYGDVVIILNSDEWLMRKKGYVFMPWDQRAAVVSLWRGVVDVIPVDDSDGTVCEALRRIKPDVFSKGGDRGPDNTPEADLCKKMGIELLWNIGGHKTNSSSELVGRIRGTSKT